MKILGLLDKPPILLVVTEPNGAQRVQRYPSTRIGLALEPPQP